MVRRAVRSGVALAGVLGLLGSAGCLYGPGAINWGDTPSQQGGAQVDISGAVSTPVAPGTATTGTTGIAGESRGEVVTDTPGELVGPGTASEASGVNEGANEGVNEGANEGARVGE